MLDKLKDLLTFTKKEVRQNAGSAFIVPVLKSIKKDIDELERSFQHLEHLIDSGFKIGFDKIPSEYLSDLIEKTQEFSALIEASDVADKIKITELLAKLHDNAARCSGMVTFLVNSVNPEQNIEKINTFFENIRTEFIEISKLL